MDQRRNRGRTFHGVRQPGVQQELRRLAHGAHEEQQTDHSHGIELPGEELNHRQTSRGELVGGLESAIKIDVAEHQEGAENAQGKAEVTDAVDDEGLHRGGRGRRLGVPEPDQQIGSQPHAFPAKEHLQEVIGGHQHQHGEGEEREVGEEARAMRVLFHVANGIEVDERRHGVDHHQHDGGQRIDAQDPTQVHVTDLDPAHDLDLDHSRLAIAHRANKAVTKGNGDEHDPAQHCCNEQQACGDEFGWPVADLTAQQTGNKRPDEGQENNRLNDHSGALSPSSY